MFSRWQRTDGQEGRVAVDDFERLFPFVRKPSRYLGNEFNVVRKPWQETEVRLALIFPDLYEIGMSHYGLQVLYHVVNTTAGLLAERVYAPDLDLENMLRRERLSMFSLESRRPLRDFDVLGFTLPYELSYTNILTILELSGIPWRAKDRDSSQPLVIGGGSGSFNPEPVADFFDAILLGDGEEAILEIAALVKSAKQVGWQRRELLERLAEVPGVYVPAFFAPCYDHTGKLEAIMPLVPGYERVRRRFLADLENAAVPSPPLVPQTRIIHERLGLEIARGCTRGCRFCQAGMIYRPVRERSLARLEEIARAGIAASGFEELALLSLSSGDYACLPQLLGRLMDVFADSYVSVSMPSMRVGTLTKEVMDQIIRVRKTGFTVAPEAGTDRLRQVLNKGITEADLLETCRTAFGLGWKLMKFYFMFGLPTETADDVDAIVGLARRALATGSGGGRQINVSVATFVPKPHTPFQWEPQLSVADGFARINRLKQLLPRRGFKLKWHDPRQSFLEGVFARGDRRLAGLIEEAWRCGVRLDGWSEHFNLETWLAAGRSCGLDLESYLRRRETNEVLPWQHLDPGVTTEFLLAERDRAWTATYTPDCRRHGCQQCGVCDFKQLRPVVYQLPARETDIPESQPAPVTGASCRPAASTGRFLCRFEYSRLGAARFLSHLELLQVFFQAFRRAGLELHFSQGFNPTPKISFSPALPVGTESMAEFLDGDLVRPLADIAEAIADLNGQLPAGLEILTIVSLTDQTRSAARQIQTCYQVDLPTSVSVAGLATRLEEFLGQREFFLARERKGQVKQVDIRPLVSELTLSDARQVRLVLNSEPGQPGIKPLELLESLLGLGGGELPAARVLKLWWRPAG